MLAPAPTKGATPAKKPRSLTLGVVSEFREGDVGRLQQGISTASMSTSYLRRRQFERLSRKPLRRRAARETDLWDSQGFTTPWRHGSYHALRVDASVHARCAAELRI